MRPLSLAACVLALMVVALGTAQVVQAEPGKARAAKKCKQVHHRKCKKRRSTSSPAPAAGAPTSTASSSAGPHTLSVATDGNGFGVVESTPAGIRCPSPSCSASFDSGTTVTLTPAPEAGSAFDHWSGACSGSGPCQVTMDADRSVTATFSSDLRTLTVQVTSDFTTASDGGAVTSDAGSINCRESSGLCTEQFAYGAVVTLSESADSGWGFWGWGGAVTCSRFALTCQVTMDADRSVTADFIDS